ncbi:hypothetical protein [Mycobacterium uberis]|uniref:hypothetical protein n=1 Tax=Mycobacterium uberis TaxID=2162698 RepID=UPI001058F2D4
MSRTESAYRVDEIHDAAMGGDGLCLPPAPRYARNPADGRGLPACQSDAQPSRKPTKKHCQVGEKKSSW